MTALTSDDPIVSYSGIRFSGHRPDFTLRVAKAYNEFLYKQNKTEGTMLLASDTREHSPLYKEIFASALHHYDLFDLGVIPTPVLHYAVNKMAGVVGAVMVTASHNGPDYNGFKIMQPSGLCLDYPDIRWIYDLAMQYAPLDLSIIPVKSPVLSLANDYFERVENKVPSSRSSLRVLIDSCNGAAREYLPMMMRRYSRDVAEIGDRKVSGLSRHPHPVAANLDQLVKLMKTGNFDVGFATDSDGDRLAIIDENGNVLDESYTTAFAIWNVLDRKPGSVVCNLSSSRMIDDLVAALGGTLYKSPVGELKVAHSIKNHRATIGGEPSCGGVIYPAVGMSRDGIVAAALVLSLMQREGKSVSELVSAMPGRQDLYMEQQSKRFTGDLFAKFESLEAEYADNCIANREDGLRIDSRDFWFGVRRSNTEPIIRIIVESKNKDMTHQLSEKLDKIFV